MLSADYLPTEVSSADSGTGRGNFAGKQEREKASSTGGTVKTGDGQAMLVGRGGERDHGGIGGIDR